MLAQRMPGELLIRDELCTALALYRTRNAISDPAELPLPALADVEAKLDTRLPDELLACLAAAGRDPYQLLVLTEDAREECRLPKRYVAFGHDPTSRCYWCIDLRAPDHERTRVFRWSIDDASATSDWSDLTTFVRWRYGLEEELGHEMRRELAKELDRFAPKVVDAREALDAPRVYHPVFGVGIVLQELTGKQAKLEIDFGPAGRRLVLASYVREIETPEILQAAAS